MQTTANQATKVNKPQRQANKGKTSDQQATQAQRVGDSTLGFVTLATDTVQAMHKLAHDAYSNATRILKEAGISDKYLNRYTRGLRAKQAKLVLTPEQDAKLAEYDKPIQLWIALSEMTSKANASK